MQKFINLLETGEIVQDLGPLSKKYAFTLPTAILAALRKGRTFEPAPARIKMIESDAARLRSLLDEALRKTKLPEAPDDKTVRKLNDFLLKLRRKNWKAQAGKG